MIFCEIFEYLSRMKCIYSLVMILWCSLALVIAVSALFWC